MNRVSILKYLVLLFTLVINSTGIFAEDEVSLRLGTASKAGNYFPLGKSISAVFDTAETPIRIEVLETKGSVDNILQLSRGTIDLAIVQNDVAFFAENGLEPFSEEIQNLAGIASFYLEPIYVLTNDPAINYLPQLVNSEVNIGPVGSGLYTDARIILNSQDLWSVIRKQYDSPNDGIESLIRGNISAAFTNVISDSQRAVIRNGNINLIPISMETISRLEKTYPYFTAFEKKEFGLEQTTIAVKSLLICRENLDEDVIYAVISQIYENFGLLNIPHSNASTIRENITESMSLNEFHTGAEKYFQDIGILKPQTLFNYSWMVLVGLASVIIIIFLLNIFLFSRFFKSQQYIRANSKLYKYIENVHTYVTQHKYLLVLLFMVTAYFTIIVLVKQIEHNWAIHHNSVSNFDNQTFVRNLLWMFVFGGSGYSDNLFPNSPVAKFFVTLIPLIGIGGFLTMVGFLTSDHIKNRLLTARGVKSKMIKDHIILCGWNENVPFLIDNLMHENILFKKPIVVLAEIEDEMPLASNNIDYDLVTYVRGQATRKSDLDRANIQEADIAIIVADSQSSDPDAKSILKILTLEKYGYELEEQGKRKNRDNIYTIAEIQDAENFQAAYDAYVDEIISLGHIKSKIFVQSVLNPGVSKFINEILTYNEFNDIYSIKLDKKSSLVGSTFDEILIKLRQQQVLLLSISIGNHKSRKEVKKIKEKYQLERTVLTNPILENELKYQTQPDDILIVLAQYEKTVQEALKALEN